jgi:DNA-binding Xre family transcriptional regulator
MVRIRVSELLRERGMTQAELARKSGLPRSNINKLVNHPEELSKIGIGTIDALCRVFSV